MTAVEMHDRFNTEAGPGGGTAETAALTTYGSRPIMNGVEKPVEWMGDSREVIRSFPEDVRDVMGVALYHAQRGGKHRAAKPMVGHAAFKGGAVMEIVDDFDTNTYRAMYTTKIGRTVYVLHVFQKKSTRGIATPRNDMNVIVLRLAAARRHDAQQGGTR